MFIATPRARAAAQDDGWAAQAFRQDVSPRLVVDQRLTVLAVNNAAERLLAGRCPLRIREGALSAPDRAGTAALAALAAATVMRSTIVGRSGHPEVLVESTPLGHGAAAFRLRDLTTSVGMRLADLSAYGLTAAEQQVVELLMQGLTVNDAADRLGRSVFTVRTHVKRAYQKLGISAREHMFARLLRFIFLS